MGNSNQLFNQLVIGLVETSQAAKEKGWQYSPNLLRVANALVVKLGPKYPPTITGLRKLLATPLHDWWPREEWLIPESFDASSGLMEGQLLSEEASHYYYNVLLDEADLSPERPEAVRLALDNYTFRQIIRRLHNRKTSHPQDEQTLQKEYVLLRRFLIEHPIVSAHEIVTAFAATWVVTPQVVSELYEPCTAPQWVCKRCGPLYREDGQLRGIRPSVCSDHLSRQVIVEKVENVVDLRRIRPGIHWRTCFPGIPELSLYDAIKALSSQFNGQLGAVELWPGLDQYDLRLHFNNDGSVWAVDVKDHRDPQRLGKELKAISGRGTLSYNLGFYVIPDRWLDNNPEVYLRQVRQAAELPTNNEVLGMSRFIEKVTNKLKSATKTTSSK